MQGHMECMQAPCGAPHALPLHAQGLGQPQGPPGLHSPQPCPPALAPAGGSTWGYLGSKK